MLKERELAAATAELQALRAQLDPHFLFNTLHSLTQLAHEDPDATERALEQFAQLMRYVLNAGREGAAGTSLEDEMGFVRNYLALERMRLGDRLRVVEKIEPDALELEIPPLMIHARERRFLVHLRLQDLEKRLPRPPFLRVHRSHIVSLDHVDRMVWRDDGRMNVHVRGGAVITASRTRSPQIRQESH